MNKEAIINLLNKYNQKNMIELLDNVDEQKREKLINQILEIDFEQIDKLYKSIKQESKESENIEPIKYIDRNNLTQEQKKELCEIGKEIIKKNQYAVVTMAGGQGTRLGWKGPKGTFKLNVTENGKYIFEILVDTLKRASKKFGTDVYWYIMTSLDNNQDTINFFEEHKYFGYDKNKVKFFTQGVLPLIDFEGNLLVDKKMQIRKASDGNGGVYGALKDSGMLQDMKNKGVKWTYVCGVDNIMANMVDDLLLGLAIKQNVESASKSVKKACPEEKVGIFCKKNGKPGIIEYIEMNEEMIYAKDENNELLYGESNIVGHLFTIEALEKMSNYNFKYHFAKKKNYYIDKNENEIIPNEPNSYKFEAFIFDGFEVLNDMAILRVKREEEFAPIKNAEGVDSPQTAKRIYESYFEKNN